MNKYDKLMIKSEDVYNLIFQLFEIGWSSIRENSINRIMYISAVLYTFVSDDKGDNNLFSKDYHFYINISGPEDPDIERAIVNLMSNEKLVHTENGYVLSDVHGFGLSDSTFSKKKDWFADIAYLVGIYGEDRIFDFIYKDKEYQNNIKTNSTYLLDLGENNRTIEYLNQFKDKFEKEIKGKEHISHREYLQLYFEYTFGLIIKGEK